MPRCRQDVTYAHIHPCHLVQSAPGSDQPVRIHMDIIVCPALIIIDDPFHDRVHLFYKLRISRCPEEEPDTVDKEQRRICRIVHRLVLSLREQVRHEAVSLIFCKCSQDRLCIFILPGRNAHARQSDHRIPPPVLEERESCQYRLTPGRFPT